MDNVREGLALLRRKWKIVFASSGFLTFFLMSVIPEQNALAYRTAAVTILMSVLWVTELVPLFVTSLLPVVLYPILGIMGADEVSSLYINDSVMLFLGAILFAISVQRWNLHRRFALRLLTATGPNPYLLLLGCMGITAFLSCWMSNTATTGVMAPLVHSILTEIDNQNKGTPLKTLKDSNTIQRDDQPTDTNTNMENDEIQNTGETQNGGLQNTSLQTSNADMQNLHEVSLDNSLDNIPIITTNDNEIVDSHGSNETLELSRTSLIKKGNRRAYSQLVSEAETSGNSDVKNFNTAGMLSVCYSASIGGISTLVGTGPNLALVQQMKVLFPKAKPISFLAWMAFAFPLAVVYLLLVWGYFCLFYCKGTKIKVDNSTLRQQYLSLGPITREEWVVIGSSLLMILLWITRSGIGTFGWNDWLELPEDGTVAMFICILLFVFPARKQNGDSGSSQSSSENESFVYGVLPPDSIMKVNWGVIILLGGGFAIAKGFVTSGLSLSLGNTLAGVGSLPRFVIILVIAGMISVVTEFTSNIATANVVIPILASLAQTIGENALLFIIPGTIACSFAFMLPMATPPNAIVFSSGKLKVTDMVKAGLVIDIMGILLVTVWTILLGRPIFDIELGEVPDWEKP
eukprot:TRINITY_DN3240_c0_g1_i2.p1 TRINITY_DN3240_c0_g1~~TRINITY_DN3240_c0_g1_i2.p1  ORF type:complete len:632 (-),score=88.40 TRINITY_DN3240_c0_g1_i2:49-1944(-)